MCFCWHSSNARIQRYRSMVSHSFSKCITRTKRVDLWRQQVGRINRTNYVFELIVRTSKKSFRENISKRKNQYTRLTRLGVHRYFTRHYQNHFTLDPNQRGC